MDVVKTAHTNHRQVEYQPTTHKTACLKKITESSATEAMENSLYGWACGEECVHLFCMILLSNWPLFATNCIALFISSGIPVSLSPWTHRMFCPDSNHH